MCSYSTELPFWDRAVRKGSNLFCYRQAQGIMPSSSEQSRSFFCYQKSAPCLIEIFAKGWEGRNETPWTAAKPTIQFFPVPRRATIEPVARHCCVAWQRATANPCRLRTQVREHFYFLQDCINWEEVRQSKILLDRWGPLQSPVKSDEMSLSNKVWRIYWEIHCSFRGIKICLMGVRTRWSLPN